MPTVKTQTLSNFLTQCNANTKEIYKNSDPYATLQNIEFRQIKSSPTESVFKINILTQNRNIDEWHNNDFQNYNNLFSKFGNVYADKNDVGVLYLGVEQLSKVKEFIHFLKADLGFNIPNTFEKNVLDKASVTKTVQNNYYDLSKVSPETIEKMLLKGELLNTCKDAFGNTLLHMAYYKNNFPLAKTALTWGVYIDSTNNKGDNIMSLAVKNGDFGWYDFASKNGANKYFIMENNDTLLHNAIKAFKNLAENKQAIYKSPNGYFDYSRQADGYKNIIKDLSKEHKLIWAQNNYGDTPLNLAARVIEDPTVCSILLNELDQTYTWSWTYDLWS